MTERSATSEPFQPSMAREHGGLTEQCIIAVASSDVKQTVFIDSLTLLIVSIDEKSRDNRQTHSEICKIKKKENNKGKMLAHVISLHE